MIFAMTKTQDIILITVVIILMIPAMIYQIKRKKKKKRLIQEKIDNRIKTEIRLQLQKLDLDENYEFKSWIYEELYLDIKNEMKDLKSQNDFQFKKKYEIISFQSKNEKNITTFKIVREYVNKNESLKEENN